MSNKIGNRVKDVEYGPGLPTVSPYVGFRFFNTTTGVLWYSTTKDAPTWKMLANSNRTTTQSNRNHIINSNFDIWQENTSFTVNASQQIYTADQWKVGTDTDSTISVTREDFVTGQTLVPNEPVHYFQYTNNGGTSSYNFIEHPIEDVRVFSGKTVTLSFYACSSVKDATVFPVIHQYDGNSAAAVEGTIINLTTSFQKYTQTFVLPIIEAVYGTTHAQLLRFYVQENLTHTFKLAQVKLEIGNAATVYTRPTFKEELDSCQRYYQTSYSYGTPVGSITRDGVVECRAVVGGAANQRIGNIKLQTAMRVVPTITTYNPDDYNSEAVNMTANNECSNTIAERISDKSAVINADTSIGRANINDVLGVHWSANARIQVMVK